MSEISQTSLEYRDESSLQIKNELLTQTVEENKKFFA